MLEAPDDVRELLRCPRSGAPLTGAADGSLAAGAARYDVVDGLPVLIDFDRSVIPDTTVFAPHAGVVVRSNHSGIKSLIKRLLSPEKPITRSNVTDFIHRLKIGNPAPRVLVIGGGTVGQGMAALYDDPALKLVCFDLYWSRYSQFIADAHAIPLADACVDGVVIQAVLEHVLVPEQVVAEIWRVLAPDGIVYAETPFLQQVHEGPYDFTRFTESGHRYLFRRFSLIRSGACGGLGTQLAWSIDYFVRGVTRSRIAGKAAKLAFAWLHLFDRIIPESHASDGASGSYFMGAKSDTELTPQAAIDFYRGAQ